MSVEIGFIGLIALGILLVLRFPIAISLILVSFAGITAMIGPKPALGILSNTPHSFAASWTLSAVPMFLLMGFVAFHAGLTRGLFDAAKILLRRLPGGLAISSIFACSAFAAVSGSSVACAASMGRIAIPEMVAAGYKPSIAAGTIAAGGTIGALIPPSILMIVYGVFAETSITQVFLGGISIGIATAIFYCVTVLIICWLRPDLLPPVAETAPVADARRILLQVLPIALLIVLIFFGLFSGIFAATEAGAVGAMGTIVLSLVTGRFSRQIIVQSLLQTVITSASLFIIGVGATMFTRFLGLSGLSGFIASFFAQADLEYYHLMIAIVLVYLVLGTFMEPFGAMLITLPIFLPLLRAEGISLVWFGVLVVKMLEIGMITPPVGMNVFVIKNVAGKYVNLTQIFRGVLPFFLADLVVVAVIVVAPGVVLFLPNAVG